MDGELSESKGELDSMKGDHSTMREREVGAVPDDAGMSSDECNVRTAQRKLFIGGLSSATNSDMLYSHMLAYGEIEHAEVLFDKRTGRSRGFGFVTFKSPASVDRAIDCGRPCIGGKDVEFKRLDPTRQIPRSKPGSKKTKRKGMQRQNSGSNGSAPPSPVPAIPGPPGSTDHRVDIAPVYWHPYGMHHPMFSSVPAAYGGYSPQPLGRPAFVPHAFGIPHGPQPIVYMVPTPDRDAMTHFDAGEEVVQRKIFVGGIGNRTSSGSLRAFFSSFGPVVDARIATDRVTGRSRGFGFVIFDSADVVQTVLKNPRYTLDGSNVEVKAANPKATPSGQKGSHGLGVFEGAVANMTVPYVGNSYRASVGNSDGVSTNAPGMGK